MLVIVRSFSTRVTKNGKPFGSMKVWNGKKEYSVNLWDYDGEIEPGTVLDVIATETVWNNIDQLDVKSWAIGDAPQGYFLPRLGNIDELWAEWLAIVDAMEEGSPARKLMTVVTEKHGESIRLGVGAKRYHHAYVGGLLEHSLQVYRTAVSILDNDLVACGALLHDLGKVMAYDIGEDIAVSKLGEKLDHIVCSIIMIERLSVVLQSDFRRDLYHIILSHHGYKEWGSPVEPKTNEAWAVHLGDMASAKMEVTKDEM